MNWFLYDMDLRHERVKNYLETLLEKNIQINVVHCAIWYHLYNLKNVKNIHGGVLILVKLQASACN